MRSTSKLPILNNDRYENFGTLSDSMSSPDLRDLSDKNYNFGHSNFYIGRVLSNLGDLLRVLFRARNPLLREFLAELFGTFLFLSFSLASVAQFVFSDKTSFLSVNIAFGLSLTLAIIAVGKVSGGHLNPAVSLSMFLLGRISIVKLLIYSIAQFLGAFFASLMVFITYLNQLGKYKNGMFSLDTAGIFATFPNDLNDQTNTFSMFFDQFFSTSLFIITILSITDKRNNLISHELVALFIGLSLTAIGCSFGYNCGFAVNPARDLAPRIFTSIAGWGSAPFTAGNHFFWVPMISPMLGSLVGTFLYSLFISNHWPTDEY